MWNLPRPGIHPVSPAFAGTTEPPGKSRSRILFVPFIFNWSLIELQYYVSFCQTSTWISHRYTYVLESPSLFRPHPTLLRSRILKLGFSFFILNRHFFFFFLRGCSVATHSSILAWKIPWMEEPGRLQTIGVAELDTTEQLHFHFLCHTPCSW